MPADLETNIGEVVDIVRHVADVAAAVGGGLRAGQFIICGSLTAPMLLEPGERGIDFELAPIGAISVDFPDARATDFASGGSRLRLLRQPATVSLFGQAPAKTLESS